MKKILRLSAEKIASIEALAQGTDQVELSFTVTLTDNSLPYSERHQRYTSAKIFTWDEVYRSFAPHLLSPSKISAIKSGINRLIREHELESTLEDNPGLNVGAFCVSDSSLQMVTLQFTAMGFIDFSNIENKEGKILKIASLTAQGRTYLINASAVKRGVIARARQPVEETDATDDEIDINDL